MNEQTLYRIELVSGAGYYVVAGSIDSAISLLRAKLSPLEKDPEKEIIHIDRINSGVLI